MLPTLLRSTTRLPIHTSLPRTIQHGPHLPLLRALNTNANINKRPIFQNLDKKISSSDFHEGFFWGVFIATPVWLYTTYQVLRGRYDLWLCIHESLRRTVKEELANVRVIFEDQAQWMREERWDPLLRSVDREGREAEYNFVKVRVSDAVKALHEDVVDS